MLPDYPPAFWLCAVLAMIIFGISKAGFGGGIGVIATPLVSLTIPVTDAVALLLPLLIITDVFSISHYRMHFHRRSIKLLLPGALLGVAIGGLFLSFFRGNERVLQIAIGVVALWFVLFQTLRAIILGMLEKRRPRVSKGVLMGALSGFTSTVAHAGGPPFTMYLLPQKFPRDLYVGTAVIFFAVVNLVKLIPYHALGFLRVGNYNQRNAQSLGEQVIALQGSLDQLRQVEREGLEGLSAEAQEAEAELAALRAGFPKLGEPFDLFRRGFSLAAGHQVEIESVARGVSVLQETPVGFLSITTFTIQSVADLLDCLAYTGSLEDAGLETLALDNVNMLPEAQRCDFQVILASAAPAPPDPPVGTTTD